MSKQPVTYAFIDSQNLNLGVSHDVVNQRGRTIYEGRKLDWRRFRHYLREKYGVSKAYIFIGMMPGNNQLYEQLQLCGFTLIFKEIVEFINKDGETEVKGNVDTDLVLWAAAREFANYDRAVFASGDGDFLSLYQFMDENNKLERIIVPNRYRFSRLLKFHFYHKLVFIDRMPNLLKPKQKTGSGGRITSLGKPGHRDKTSVTNSKKKVNSKKGAKQ
ncbi:NYN domain-containing protein [Candidatus Saccharibacteria bacterium]|nr:NYN domain-containing protein [Candidatus Saccharibacteria bacterium]MCL1962927.1 NYN domain-containing protein [Candidatus Saccharibacteria bacterium]